MSLAYTGNYNFEGLDARRAASDGAIRDMTNMSRRFYPAMASRTKRRVLDNTWGGVQGVYFGDRDIVARDNGLYDDGEFVCALTSGEKQMAVLEDLLYIFPDGITYNMTDGALRNYKAEVLSNFDAVSKFAAIDYKQRRIGEGDIIEVEYIADDLILKVSDFDLMPFKSGEYVRITIKRIMLGGIWRDANFETVLCPDEIGRATVGEDEIYCHYMEFPLGTFDEITEGGRGQYRIEVEIAHPIPDMDFVFASDNRLWGAKGRNMYASALGQGMVWMNYDTLTTSSWAAATRTGETITAALDFGGMPIFFCESSVYKVYGENPKEFQFARAEIVGVSRGMHRSVAVGAGYIFYMSRRGIYAWTGGVPQLISAPLGEERITDAVGGSDGVVYYLSAKQGGRHNLYAFDPMTNVWMREDDAHAVYIGMRRGDLCMIDTSGVAWLIGEVYGTDGAEEHDVRYSMETADYNDGAVVQKSAKNILIQYELANGSADVLVSYDGEPWSVVYTLHETYGDKITSVIPLQAKMYRTMRIAIAGDGEIIIYYMVRDVAAGTARPGGENNVYV